MSERCKHGVTTHPAEGPICGYCFPPTPLQRALGVIEDELDEEEREALRIHYCAALAEALRKLDRAAWALKSISDNTTNVQMKGVRTFAGYEAEDVRAFLARTGAGVEEA